MDYDTFSLVSLPFSKTRDGAGSAETRPFNAPNEVTVQAYKRYFDVVHTSVRRVVPQDNLGTLLSSYMNSINEVASKISSPLLPELRSDHMGEFVERWNSSMEHASSVHFLNVTLAAAAAFISEAKTAIQTEFNLAATRHGAALTAEIASYNAWLVAEEQSQGMRSRHMASITEFESRTKEVFDSTGSLIATGNRAISDLRAENATVGKEIAEARLEVDRVLASFRGTMTSADETARQASEGYQALTTDISTRQADVDAFKNALREEAKIEAAKILWDQRARAASQGFWVSAFMLLFTLVCVPAYALFNLDTVIASLRHISETTLIGVDQANAEGGVLIGLAINRVVIVTVPLALYFWMVKLLVRFNLRSQLLMDDARQRHTMMNTYFHLIEKQSAVKEDRALILNALFRPAPGQPKDSVEALNFTELVGKTMVGRSGT